MCTYNGTKGPFSSTTCHLLCSVEDAQERMQEQGDTSAIYFPTHKEFAAQELLELVPLYLVLATSALAGLLS